MGGHHEKVLPEGADSMASVEVSQPPWGLMLYDTQYIYFNIQQNQAFTFEDNLL